MVRAVPISEANSLDCLGTDIDRNAIWRNWLAFADVLNARAGLDLVGDHVIDRQQNLHTFLFGVLQRLLRQLDLVGFQQRLADFVSLSLEEGVGHTSADDEGIDLAHQVLNDADFVAHLGAAQNRDERLLGMSQRFAEILQLLFHEQAGCALLHKVGDALGGGVCAMRGAERIVHIEVTQIRELPGKFLFIRFLFGVEAKVLQQQSLPLLQLLGHLLRLQADAVGREANVFAASQNVVQQNS